MVVPPCHIVGWCRTTFGFFVRPTPAPGTIIDHSIGAKVLVAVQGPWRLSARADRKKTLTDAYLDYTHTVTEVTDGEVQRGTREAAEGRERVFHETSFESHRARIPGEGKGLKRYGNPYCS